MDKLKIRKNKFVGEKQDRNNNFLIRLGNLNNFYAKIIINSLLRFLMVH
jgi:hypothetical protein